MKIINVEEHFKTPELDEAQAAVLGSAPPTPPEHYGDFAYAPNPEFLYDIADLRLQEMDKYGIDMQVISNGNAAGVLDPNEGPALIAAANDKLHQAITQHPTRFAGLANLPYTNPDAAVAELRRTVTELGFKGAILNGRPAPDATFIDDERYDAILATCEELDVPIYVHPGVPCAEVSKTWFGGLPRGTMARLSKHGFGWHQEAGVQVLLMIFNGVFDRHPNLKVISGHWGEMVPFWLDRLDQALPPRVSGIEKLPSEYYRNNVWVSPSGMLSMDQFIFTVNFLGADRVMYSVDYPYYSDEGAAEFLENAPFDQETKEKIAHGNAEKLFKLA